MLTPHHTQGCEISFSPKGPCHLTPVLHTTPVSQQLLFYLLVLQISLQILRYSIKGIMEYVLVWEGYLASFTQHNYCDNFIFFFFILLSRFWCVDRLVCSPILS